MSSTSSAKTKPPKDDVGTTTKKQERSASVPPPPVDPCSQANAEKMMQRALLEMEVRLKQELISKVVPLNEKVSLELSCMGKEMAKNYETLALSMNKHDNGIKTVLKSLMAVVSRLDKISREQESIRRELDAIKRSLVQSGGSPAGHGSPYYGVEAQYVRNTATTSYYQQRGGAGPTGFPQAPAQVAAVTPPTVYANSRRPITGGRMGAGRTTPWHEQQQMMSGGRKQRRDTPRPSPYAAPVHAVGLRNPASGVPISNLMQPTQPARQWTTRGDGTYTSDDEDDNSEEAGPGTRSVDKSSREEERGEEVTPPAPIQPTSGARSSSKAQRGEKLTETESKIHATLAAMAMKSSESAVNPSKSSSSTSVVPRVGTGGFGAGRRGVKEDTPASGPTVVDTGAKEPTIAPGGFGVGRRGKGSQPNQVSTRPLTVEELGILAMAAGGNRDGFK